MISLLVADCVQERPSDDRIILMSLAGNLLSKKMEHSTAQKLMDAYKRIGEAINEADSIIHTLPKNEQTAYLGGLGDMVGHLWLKLQLPVVREHRDLDPDGDRFQRDSK